MVLSQAPNSPCMQALPQILAVSVRNTLLVGFGLSMSFPTILIPGLTRNDEPLNIPAEGLTWIGSIHLICVPLGNLFSGTVSKWTGRKRTMQLVNVLFCVAWLIFRFANMEWQVIVALALSGFAAGLSEASTVLYVAEVTQPRLRGVLSTTSSISGIGGVFVMFLLGTFFAWRKVALLSCIFNVISFICLFFVPESPHWLISRNRLLDARKALAWLRGWTDLEEIEEEFKQVYRELKADGWAHDHHNPALEITNRNTISNVMFVPESAWKKSKATILNTVKPFTQKSFLWPLSLVSSIFLISHVTGMSTLQTYSVLIFQTLRVPINKYYATLSLGCVELLACIFSAALLHYTGKRLLNFISILGCGLGFTVVGTYAQLNGITRLIINNKNGNLYENATIIAEGTDNHYQWIPLAFLAIVAFSAYLGLRVLPWILLGEVFSVETRTHAAGICSAVSFMISFAVNKEFFSIIGLLTLPGTFFMHAFMALVGFIVLYIFLPETEGKTLAEINEHFAGGAKMDNHVFRTATDVEPVR